MRCHCCSLLDWCGRSGSSTLFSSAAVYPLKAKVKVTLEQVTKAQKWSSGVALLFLNLGARWGWVVNAAPRPLYPWERPRYLLYRRLAGSQGGSGRVGKISSPPGFDPWTVQPVASRYADWAIPPRGVSVVKFLLLGTNETWWSVANEEWIAMRKEMILGFFFGVSNKFI
jgi:hypothetical protein